MEPSKQDRIASGPLQNPSEALTRWAASPLKDRWPTVSVVIPVLNEELHIEACLQSVMAQDYPAHALEVIVVDGNSTDRTVPIVRALMAEDSRIHLLSNPRRRTPFAMNIGVHAAQGEVVIRIDGHSVVSADHVRALVAFLLRSGADHVGGLMRARGHNYVSSTIALALSSPAGVGSARFRYTTREQDIDTVPFGAFRRETILQLGGFDERLFQGQDSEFDFRITCSGGRVRISPAISTDYWCRDSLPRLGLQFFRYGRAKANILRKHGGLPSPRALAPATLVSLMISLVLLAPAAAWARAALRSIGVAYASTCVLAGIIVGARRGPRYIPLLPVTFMVLHISHGLGFLRGLLTFLSLRSAAEAQVAPLPAEGVQQTLGVAEVS